MPLFQYKCNACDAEHEVLVRGEASPECPTCGSPDLIKLASAFAALTGSGSARDEVPMPCGSPSCCQLQGGGCPLN